MKPVKNSHVNFIYKHTIFCLPLFPVKLPSDLPNCSIRPAIHLCVAPCPLQVLRYIRSPSLCLFPLKRSLPEARISPRHLPTRSRSQTRRCFRLVSRRRPEPFPVLLRLPSFSPVFESLVHVSQAFVVFFPFRIRILFFKILLYRGKHTWPEIHVPHGVADRGREVVQKISRTYSVFNPFSGSASLFCCQKCLKMFLFCPYP